MLHQDFVWETACNYTERREIFRCDFGPRNGTENICDIDGCFVFFFFIKKSHNKFLEKLTRIQNNIRGHKAVFSHFDHSWDHGHLRGQIKFTVSCLYWKALSRRGGGRERERQREISAMAFTNVITGEIFELICTYLHLQAPRVYQHTKDLANF